MSGIFVASKSNHSVLWRNLRQLGPYSITATWIDAPKAHTDDERGELWRTIIDEIREADVVLALYEPEEDWKGAYIEIGAALLAGVPVLVLGDPPGTWMHHPLVTRVTSIRKGIMLAQAIVETVRASELAHA